MHKSVLIENLHLNDINPIQCGYENCEPLHFYGPAVRSFYLLHYVVSGKGVYKLNNKSYKIGAGECFIIRPGETTYYEADKNDPWEYIWVGFESGIPLPDAMREDVVYLPKAGVIFKAIQECDKTERGRELILCGHIYHLIALFLHNENNEEQRYIERAKNYIETEYMKQISVSELAQKLNLNRCYFSNIFKEQTGASPQQYLIKVRMEKSKELIYESGFTVSEAATAVGYPDIFSFSRMFKKYHGISPVALKNK